MLNQLQPSKQARQSTNNQLNQFQGLNVARYIQFLPYYNAVNPSRQPAEGQLGEKTFQGNGGISKITSSHLRPIRASKLASGTTYLPVVHPALYTTTIARRLPLRTYKSIREHVVKSPWQAYKTKPVGGYRKYSTTYT